MSALLQATYHCEGCDRFFMGDVDSFEPYYFCEDDGEYWSKDDGRNCPTCHKWGRNTEQPVCGNCQEEVEDCNELVDPNEVTVVGLSGAEIVTKKRKATAKKEEAIRAARKKEADARYKKYKAILLKEFGKKPKQELSLSGDYVVAFKSLKAIDSVITVTAEVSMDSHFWDSGEGNPFELSFRIYSGGFKGRYRDDGGFGHSCGDSVTFANLTALVAYAEARVGGIAFL